MNKWMNKINSCRLLQVTTYSPWGDLIFSKFFLQFHSNQTKQRSQIYRGPYGQTQNLSAAISHTTEHSISSPSSPNHTQMPEAEAEQVASLEEDLQKKKLLVCHRLSWHLPFFSFFLFLGFWLVSYLFIHRKRSPWLKTSRTRKRTTMTTRTTRTTRRKMGPKVVAL